MTIKPKQIIILSVLVLLIAGGVYIARNMGGYITQMAETIASNALGVKVDIGSIDVSLSDKKVTVNSVKIGNPPGYRQPYAMTSDTIAIGLNTASKELIDFKDIQVKGSVVYMEINEQGMNLLTLKKLANSTKQKESAGSEQVRVIIKHMVIDASVIKPSITFLSREIDPIRMPAISFNNIGSSKGGTSAGDAIVQVLTKYLSSVQQQARSSGALNGVSIPGLDDAEGALDGISKRIKGLFD